MNRDEVIAAMMAADAAGDEAGAKMMADLLAQMGESVEAAPLEDRGAGEAIRHGLQQGATFGFADEASAAGRAGLDKIYGLLSGDDTYDDSFGNLYEMYRDSERGQIAAGREHHGGKMFAAEMLPGLVQGGAGLLGKGAQAGGRQMLDQLAKRTLGQNIGRGAGVGAGYGATAGLGYGESEDLAGMAGDVALGAGMGATVGAALPAAVSGVKAGARNIAGRFGAQSGVDAATKRAQIQLQKEMMRDRMTPEALERAFKADPDAFLMDLGPAMRERAKVLTRQPGAGGERIRENVMNRQLGEPARLRPGMRGFIQKAFKDEDAMLPENFATHERQLMERGRKMADDQGLWQNAYSPDYKAPRSLLEFLRTSKGRIKNPDARAADKTAKENLQRRIAIGEIQPDDPGMLARYHEEVLRAFKGNIKLAQVPVAATAKIGETTSLMLRQHRKLIDDFTPAMNDDWRAARKLWAGTQANRDAYQAGGKVLTEYADDVGLRISDFKSASEVDNYLVGALRRIEHDLARKGDTTDILRTLRQTAHGREIMRHLAGSEKNFNEFLRMAKAAQNRLKTFSEITGGSDTAKNLGGMADAATKGGERGTLLGIISQANVPGLRGVAGVPLIFRAGGRRMGNWFANRDEMTRDAMSDMLLSRNPQQLQQQMIQPPMPSANPSAMMGLGLSSQLPGLLED